MRLRHHRTHPDSGVHGLRYAPGYHSEVVRASDIDVKQKADEVAIVEMANAVVDPRAVVICGATLH